MTYQDYRNEIARLQKRLDDIKTVCQRHAHPSVKTEAHALANKIVGMVEKQDDTTKGARDGSCNDHDAARAG